MNHGPHLRQPAPDDALRSRNSARLLYEVRSARDEVLGSALGAANDVQALASINGGDIPEHPGYEDYVSARILAGLTSQIRAELATRLEVRPRIHNLLLELSQRVDSHYGPSAG